MRDIQSREDIVKLVDTFYEKAMKDKLIGHFFTTVIDLDLEKHLPIIHNFWASSLLGDSSYKGNAMSPHFKLNEKSKMEKSHFDQWLALWIETSNELFEGPIIEDAIQKAKNISALMEYKVRQREEGF